MADGEVVKAYYDTSYGNIIIYKIKYVEDVEIIMSHNKKNLVKEGDHIKKGDVIGIVGSTGNSTGPHVHFEIRYKGVAINPMKIFDI